MYASVDMAEVIRDSGARRWVPERTPRALEHTWNADQLLLNRSR